MARAITSPSGLLLAGAGASIAILAGAPLAVAAGAAALAWVARVAVAAPRRKREDRIDPFTLGDPWRRFVSDGLQARARFQRTVDRTRGGPLRDRLSELGARLDDAVRECWRVACQGDALEGALKQLDVAGVQRELAETKQEKRRSKSAAVDRTIAALEAQLASAQRITAVWQDARDRLRLLNAQLDEAVARAIELSVRGAGDVSDVTPLADDVNTLVSDLEALRQALEETGGASTQTSSA